MERVKKRACESASTQQYLLRSEHINGYGRLFGGQLMSWIDELAGIVSRRHCGKVVTTAAIDNLSFRKAAYINDLIVLKGEVTYVGRSSMEVRVDTYVETLDERRSLINRAYLVMVAIDEDGSPMEVPGLELETEEQRQEWEKGRQRYEYRKNLGAG